MSELRFDEVGEEAFRVRFGKRRRGGRNPDMHGNTDFLRYVRHGKATQALIRRQ